LLIPRFPLSQTPEHISTSTSTRARRGRPTSWHPSEDALIIRLKTQTTPPASLSAITEAVNALPASCGTHTINAVKKRWLNTLQHVCSAQMGDKEKHVLRDAVREVERSMNKWKLVAEKYAELVKKEEQKDEGEAEEKEGYGS